MTGDNYSTPCDEDEEDVAVPEQMQISCFWNTGGNISIKQFAWPDDPAIIVVNPQNVAALVRKIIEVACIDPSQIWPQSKPVALPAPADPTAAERAKRYRQRHRDATVTHRDAERDGGDLLEAAE